MTNINNMAADDLEDAAHPDIDPERELPSDPEARQALVDGIIELTNAMTIAQGHKEAQREILIRVSKTTGMEKAKVRKLANWRFKGDEQAKKDAIKITSAEAAYSILFKTDEKI